MKQNNIIRATEHLLINANSNKKNNVKLFLSEYHVALQACIDYIWNNEIIWFDEKKNTGCIFNVQKDFLNVPLFIDYKKITNNTKLSARAFCSALEQAVDIVKSQVKYRSKLLYVRNKLIESKENTDYIDRCIANNILTKPIIKETTGAELSSKCIDIQKGKKHFNLFIRLMSTGFDHIKIPISYHKVNKKYKNFELLNGILITNDKIILRWKSKATDIKTEGMVVGLDTGMKNTVTFSDGQTSKSDIHGHTLDTIAKKLSKKKKGSKAFERAVRHRENYINWSINQINFDNIKQINLESVNTFKSGKRSRYLSHFSHALISEKILRIAEELGVLIKLQTCTYRSQRCSGCGMVHKGNRKGKIYKCRNCNVVIDSDFNASKNHEINLPEVPKEIVSSKLNRQGFFWRIDGFFSLDGQDIGVSDTRKNDSI